MQKLAALVTVGLMAAGCGDVDPGDGTGGFAECLAAPNVRATLMEQSSRRVRVLWNAAADRPELVHGAFRVNAGSPLEAARLFLAAHASDFHLPDRAQDLLPSATRRGLVGTYLRFAQRHAGLPVFDGEVVVHVVSTPAGFEVRDVNLAHFEDVRVADLAPSLDEAAAVTLAESAVGLAGDVRAPTEATLGILVDGSPKLAWRVIVAPVEPEGAWEVQLDARTGAVLSRHDLLRHAEGSGLVFDPNPIASTGNTSLRDVARDAEALAAARVRVTLPRLDDSGFLRGPWIDSAPRARVRANESTFVYDYDRGDVRFGQVMAYFHIDRTQNRLQELGFDDVNARRIVVNVDGTKMDNSYYDPVTRQITTGSGGTSDAEDADVFVHEYGHAVQDNQVPSFGKGEQGAMGEGFGDYLAATIGTTLGHKAYDPPCIGQWDAVGLFNGRQECLRRVDGRRHYPEGMHGEVHEDGELWSGALWEGREAIGADAMDRVVIEGHFLLAGRTNYLGAAAAVLSADENLFDGAHLPDLTRVFLSHGFSREITPPAALDTVVNTEEVAIDPPRRGSTYANDLDDTQFVSRPGALGLRLHFSRIETETGRDCLIDRACDNIYLFDGSGNLYQVLNGSRTDVISAVIPGDLVQIRLVSDGGDVKYGYRVDRVDEMGSVTCGDGVRDAGEACDRNDFGSSTCRSLGYASGTLSCRANCTVEAARCVGSATCGDGRRNGRDECDGKDLGGVTCTELGLAAGALACTAECTFDRGFCNVCGNGKREGREECDGADLAGKDCGDVGRGVGPLTCSNACTFDISACSRAECR